MGGARLDCERLESEGTLESYLLGRLDEEQRAAVEDHYFACDRCLERLEALRAARVALTRPERVGRPAHRSAWWPAAAAVGIAALGAGVWLRHADTREPSSRFTPAGGPTTASAPASSPGSVPPPAPQASFADLAVFEPPPAPPRALRGGDDEASRHFQLGAAAYAEGIYAAAAAHFREAAKRRRIWPAALLYEGVSRLLAGQAREAIGPLRATIAAGDSPYAEPARFFLAKAYLRTGDVERARDELEALVRLDGVHASEARALLERLRQRTAEP